MKNCTRKKNIRSKTSNATTKQMNEKNNAIDIFLSTSNEKKAMEKEKNSSTAVLVLTELEYRSLFFIFPKRNQRTKPQDRKKKMRKDLFLHIRLLYFTLLLL